MEKKTKSKRTLWSKKEEALLVEAWAEKIRDLRGARKNLHIYKEIVKILGCKFSPREIQVKIHNLTNRYKKEKKMIGLSGGSPSEWPLYARVHEIIGGTIINNLPEVVEESAPIPAAEESHSNIESSSAMSDWGDVSDIEEISAIASTSTSGASASTSRAANKKLNNFEKQFLEIDLKIESHLETIKESDEKMIAIEERRNEILERFLTSTQKFQDTVLTLIRKD